MDQTLGRMRDLHTPAGLAWDLVVVNNNSTDDTDAVIERHRPHLPLTRVFEPRQGHSNARNAALAAATGEVVVWTDDDVDPDPEWLAAAADAFARHPDAAAVGGPIEPWFPTAPDPDLAAVFAPLRVGYCGVDHGPTERWLGPGESIYGANMAFRRAAVAGLRFDPRTGRNGTALGSGDDLAYVAAVRAAGGKILWAPRMRLRHYVDPERMTLDYLKRYSRDNARVDVLMSSPAQVPTLFGLPRWVVRRYAAAVVRCWAAGLTGGRRRRLEATLEKWDLRGRIAGYRALARPPAAVATPAGA
ncbi:MAG: glycosyl transferase family 2 [Gemmataceae bacterium]|nr:glycosyl transferase family 2 [Gemmataceae bacterium]